MLKYTVVKIYFSEKYYKNVTHLDRSGTKEYMIDSIAKPLWVSEKLEGMSDIEIIEPAPINENDLLRVHSEKYINAVRNSEPNELASSSGLRWVPALYEATLSSVSGLYRSIETAKSEGISGTLSTNFHHAKKERGSGFCVFNGVAISVRKAIHDLRLKKVLIIDCDYHYGDGNAETLKDIEGVFLYDIYGGYHSTYDTTVNAENLKSIKVSSVEEYQKALEDFFEFTSEYNPDLVIYDAGMDFFEDDRIGGIKGVNKEFLFDRDKSIFEFFVRQNIPVAFMLGGGYVPYKDENGDMLSEEEINQKREELTELYLNTIKIASQTADSGK